MKKKMKKLLFISTLLIASTVVDADVFQDIEREVGRVFRVGDALLGPDGIATKDLPNLVTTIEGKVATITDQVKDIKIKGDQLAVPLNVMQFQDPAMKVSVKIKGLFDTLIDRIRQTFSLIASGMQIGNEVGGVAGQVSVIIEKLSNKVIAEFDANASAEASKVARIINDIVTMVDKFTQMVKIMPEKNSAIISIFEKYSQNIVALIQHTEDTVLKAVEGFEAAQGTAESGVAGIG